MKIIKGEEAKAYLATIPSGSGGAPSEESLVLRTMEPGEVLVIQDHDLSDGHKATQCVMSHNLRTAAYKYWGVKSVSLRHGSTISIHRKK
jgi:hypothetical protein